MTGSLSLKARGVASSLVEHLPQREARALAAPPPGSGLAPLMGDPGPPIIGHSFGFLQSSLEYARDFHERFGTVFWGNAFGTRLVMVLGPDGIETVLTNKDRAFANKEGWEYFIGP